MVRILCMGRKLLINEIPQNRKKMNEYIIQKHNFMQDDCRYCGLLNTIQFILLNAQIHAEIQKC